jgi:peptidoglycan/xylan/chitin deacetylase (PgdA/CDA1 family)
VQLRRALQTAVLPLGRALARLRAGRWRGVRFLCYHSVVAASDVMPLESRTLAISTQAFVRHLELIDRARYRVVSMPAALDLVDSGEAEGGQYVCFTFDDGRVDNFSIAWPLMRAAGYSAHFFISTALVGQSVPAQGGVDHYMGERELRAFVGEGGTIGSHAHNHVDLTRLDRAALCLELALSREKLQQLTGQRVTTHAYPYAQCNERVIDAARVAGYQHAFVIGTGTVSHGGRNALTLPRNVIRSGIDPAENYAVLRGGMDFTRIYSATKARLRHVV